MRKALEQAGFIIEQEEDRRDFAIDFFEGLKQSAAKGPPPLGLHVIMGDDFKTKVANMVKNIGAGHCGPREMICRKI